MQIVIFFFFFWIENQRLYCTLQLHFSKMLDSSKILLESYILKKETINIVISLNVEYLSPSSFNSRLI